MNSRCEDCIKNDVCKHIEDFDDFVKQNENNSNEFANIEITCKFKKTKIDFMTTITYPSRERNIWDEINNIPFEDATQPLKITYGVDTGKIDGDNINLK